MTTDLLLNGILCTGCAACADTCPTHSISIVESEYGFQIPKVDLEKCIDCKKCIKTCPSRTKVEKREPIQSFSAYSMDSQLYEASASGGIFATIAKAFISHGGIVFGAAFDPNTNKVKHVEVDKPESIKKLQGSKYVQSETYGIYQIVSNALKDGKKVLFSGTPCQIAALYSVLGTRNVNNLYTIEVICHGVSNNLMLAKSVQSYKKNDYPKDIRFRNKSKFDKSAFSLKLIYQDGVSKIVDSSKDLYYRLYVDGLNYRESCYECQYATRERVADITLGDCSTYKDYEMLSKTKCLSSVIINSEKGLGLWNMISSAIAFAAQNMDKEFCTNAQLSHPTLKPVNLETIYQDYFSLTVDELKQKYVKTNIKDEFIKAIKRTVPLNVRVQIRDILSRL